MEPDAPVDIKLRRALQQMGWLNKRGHWRKNWASRWFCIVEHPETSYYALNYYKSKPEDCDGSDGTYDGSAVECGSISLLGAAVFPRSGDGHPFSFSVTTAVIAGTSKTYPLRATSYEERRRWVDALTFLTTGRPSSVPGLQFDRAMSFSPFGSTANDDFSEGGGDTSKSSGGESDLGNGASSTSSSTIGGSRSGRSKSWFGGSFSDLVSQSSSSSGRGTRRRDIFGHANGRVLSASFFRKTTSAVEPPSIVDSLRAEEAAAEREADLSLAESLLVEAKREEKAVLFELAALNANERTLLASKSDSLAVDEDATAQPSLAVDAIIVLAHRTVELYRKAAELFEEHDDNEGTDTSDTSNSIVAASDEDKTNEATLEESNGEEEREKPRWAAAMQSLRSFLKHPKVQALFAMERAPAELAVPPMHEASHSPESSSAAEAAAASDNSSAVATASVDV